MTRITLEIDGKSYLKKDAIEYSRELLKTKGIIPKKSEAFNFVLWLLKQRRPLIKTTSLILKVDTDGTGRSNCFWYKEKNKDWKFFSYQKALESEKQKIVSVQGKTYSKKDYLKAFRNSVYDQIKVFREKELKKKKNTRLSSLSQADCYNVHVDHIIPIHVLISDFLKDKELKLQDVELIKGKHFNIESYFLKDEKLKEEWEIYHRQHARLQIVTKEENLSKAGTYDIPLYRYRLKREETYD